jgi:hypothetical protein
MNHDQVDLEGFEGLDGLENGVPTPTRRNGFGGLCAAHGSGAVPLRQDVIARG